jgi:thioesterase domain-containing protein
VTSFVQLISYLDKSAPVYGLQPRGIDDLSIPHSTVSAAAESYVGAIKQLGINDSIHLLGHSFGGWVVFEMAHLLLLSGCAVKSLTILDTEAPDRDRDSLREFDRTEVMIRWLDALELRLGRSLGIKTGDLDMLTEVSQRQILHEALVRERLLPARSKPDVLRGALRVFGSSLRTSYVPRAVYTRPMRLVLVNDPRLDEHSNLEQRKRLITEWAKFAPDVTHIDAPGNHFTVLEPPYVSAVADLLQF